MPGVAELLTAAVTSVGGSRREGQDRMADAVRRSLSSGEGSAAVRHDGTIVRTDTELRSLPLTIGWIRQENDIALEQRILREITGRVTNVTPPTDSAHGF